MQCHGMQISATSSSHNRILKELPKYTRKNLEAKQSITYGMTRTYGECAMIRCIPESEIQSVLHFYHSTFEGSHYRSMRIARKVLDCGLYWPTIFQDAYTFILACEQC
ncbi:hypothetical protein CR513_08863, partial [Mucuna pruriens]